MMLTRSDWPPTEAQVRLAIAGGESNLVEFKRQWWDLDRAEGRASLARQVLAFANTALSDELALLIIGVDDERHGSEIVPLQDPPSPEGVVSSLANYVHPPADVRCRHYSLPEGMISVVGIVRAPARPHYSLRDYPDIISTREVYVRRDRQIGVLTLPELELMIREKDTRLGPPTVGEPIQSGFVQLADSGSGLFVARVTNVSTEPVGGVDVVFDVRNARNPELFHRAPKLGNATLQPGESREIDFRPADVTFYVQSIKPDTGKQVVSSVRPGSYVGDRWLDISLHVNYRDRFGYIRHAEYRVPYHG